MAKTLARLVVGLAVLYALGATAYAFAHYEGAKPDVPTVLTDFNGWLKDLVVPRPNPHATSPGTPPAPGLEPTTPTAEPAVPPGAPAVEPAPEPAPGPAALPPDPLPPEGLTGEAAELWKIERVALPKAKRAAAALRTMSRADHKAFEEARTAVLAALSDTRPLLNQILERDPNHKQANRLWSSMQETYQAVKKL